MEKLIYEEPTLRRKEEALEFINEFKQYNSQIHGVGGLDRYLDNYEEWLIKLEQDKKQIPSEERVPARTFFLVRESDNKIVGMVNIRLVLNEILKKNGGHIGYSIRPSERRKGYNKINLFLALLECQKYGIKEVLLDCDKINLGSSKSMQALGGVLISEYYEDGLLEQKYKIDVDKSIEKYRNLYEDKIDNKKVKI